MDAKCFEPLRMISFRLGSREGLSYAVNDLNRAESETPVWLRMASIIAGGFRRFGLYSRQPGILVVLPGGLGDVLLFSGALRVLRRHFADGPLVVWCSPIQMCSAALTLFPTIARRR